MNPLLIGCGVVMVIFVTVILIEVFRKKKPPATQPPKRIKQVGLGLPIICPACHSLIGGGYKCRCPQSENPPEWADERRKKNVTHYRSIDDEWSNG